MGDPIKKIDPFGLAELLDGSGLHTIDTSDFEARFSQYTEVPICPLINILMQSFSFGE